MKRKFTHCLLACIIVLFAMPMNGIAQVQQDSAYINVNPDPNGEPWIAGGRKKLSPEQRLEKLRLRDSIINSRKKTFGLVPVPMGVLPPKVDNSTQKALRSVFQQTHNCCNFASSIAYQYTYEMNVINGTSADVPENQFPTHYAYNFANDGEDVPTYAEAGWKMIRENGVPTVAVYGDLTATPSFWMSGYDKYYQAMQNKMTTRNLEISTVAGLKEAKEWIYNHGRGDAIGGLINFGGNSSGGNETTIVSGEEAGKYVVAAWGNDGAHAMTIVGYNDNVCFDYNKDGKITNDIDITGDGKVTLADWEKGAFKMVNSWGTSWGDQGFAYMMYCLGARTLDEGGLLDAGLVTIVEPKKDQIDLALKVKMKHLNRGGISLSLGYNPDVNALVPTTTKEFDNFKNVGGNWIALNGLEQPTDTEFEFGLDISEFKDVITNNKGRFFLNITAGEGKGDFVSASIMDYRTNSSGTEILSNESNFPIESGVSKVHIDMLPSSAAQLKANSAFRESIANFGALNVSPVSLVNCTFSKSSGNLIKGVDYTVHNLPEGLSEQIMVISPSSAEIRLNGNALSHEKLNNIDNLEISFRAAAFSNVAIGDLAGNTQTFKVFFRDEYTTVFTDFEDIIVNDNNTWKQFYLGAGTDRFGAWRTNIADHPEFKFKLETYSNKVICNTGTFNITPLAYNTEISSTNSNWTLYDKYPNQPNIYNDNFVDWKGRDAYIGVQIVDFGETYNGWVHASISADGNDFTVHDAAFYNKPNASIKAGKANISILQIENETFAEDAVNNNGTVDKVIKRKLLSANFSLAPNSVLTRNTHYTMSGLPVGLSEEIKVLDYNYLQIRFKGNAQNHDKIDLAKVNLSFLDALFDGLNASEIKNTNNIEFTIEFIDDYQIVYSDIEDILLDEQNTWIPFTLDQAEFDFGAWYNKGLLRFESNERQVIGYAGTLNAKPISKGTRIGLSSATWVTPGAFPDEMYITNTGFTEWYGKEAYLGCTLLKNGLTHYAWIRIAVDPSGQSYTVKDWAYNERPNCPIIAGENIGVEDAMLAITNSTFIEAYSNDGQMKGQTNITLVHDEFALEAGTILTEGTHFTSSNIPAGLQCQLKVVNQNLLELNLIGKALVHDKRKEVTASISLKDIFVVNGAASIENNIFNIDVKLNHWDIIYTDLGGILADKDNIFTWFGPSHTDYGFGAWWYDKELGKIKLESYQNPVICYEGTSNIKPLPEGTLIDTYPLDKWYIGEEYPNEPNLVTPNYKELVGKESYVAFCAYNGEFYHFGWIRIVVAADELSYIVLDYAYNDEPGVPIRVGQKYLDPSGDTEAPTVPTNLVASEITQTSVKLDWNASTDNVGVILYEIESAEGIVTSSTSNSVVVSNLNPNTSYTYTVKAKDKADNISVLSTPVSFKTLPIADFCSMVGKDFSYEWITEVRVGSFTNTSAVDNGYGDFTSETINAEAGSNLNIALTPNSDQYKEHWKVWIDYNANGNFNDVGEEVFSGSAKGTTTGSISIPANVTGGTRLRVAMQYGSAPVICEHPTAGEVEDYNISFGGAPIDVTPPTVPTNLAMTSVSQTSIALAWTASTDENGISNYEVLSSGTVVATGLATSATINNLTPTTVYNFTVRAIDPSGNISDESVALSVETHAAPDTEAPTVPTNLVASEITQTSVKLNWTASTDNVAVTLYKIESATGLVTSSISNSVDVTGLTPNTIYTYTVKAIDAADNVSALSSSITFSTLSDGYCPMVGDDFTYEWITAVTLGTFTKNSDVNNGYGDFTAETIIAQAGSSMNIALTPNSAEYPEHWKVWIDYNGNGNFSDAGEEVFSGSASGTLTGTITIPAQATGNTRLRVAMRYNNDPVLCVNPVSGEVEDYTISFEGDVTPPTVPSNLATTAVTQTSVSLAWTASTDDNGISNYEVLSSGIVVSTGIATHVTVNNLSPATSYNFTVRAIDPSGNVSNESVELAVTTLGDHYCDASGTQGPEHIANVLFEGINNSSTRDAYHDYTAISANVSQGNTYPITVTIGDYYNGDRATVWFDWNQDGSFNAAEEQFVLTPNGAEASANVVVPSNASLGNTRMRVRVHYYEAATVPCDAQTYGEVEDYTVYVSGSAQPQNMVRTKSSESIDIIPTTETELQLYPNPVIDHLKIRANDIKNVKVFNMLGKLVLASNNEANLFELDLNFSDLQEGLYLVRIELNNNEVITKKVVK